MKKSKVKKNKKIVFLGTGALLIETLPFIILVLSQVFNNISENVSVLLEDLAIDMIIYGMPLLGLVTSIILYNSNKKSKIAKNIMISSISIFVIMTIISFIIFIIPWNIGG